MKYKMNYKNIRIPQLTEEQKVKFKELFIQSFKESALSQKKLADIIDVKPASLGSWLNKDNKYPKLDSLFKLAYFFSLHSNISDTLKTEWINILTDYYLDYYKIFELAIDSLPSETFKSESTRYSELKGLGLNIKEHYNKEDNSVEINFLKNIELTQSELQPKDDEYIDRLDKEFKSWNANTPVDKIDKKEVKKTHISLLINLLNEEQLEDVINFINNKLKQF